MPYLLEMRPSQLQRAVADKRPLIIPVGACEYHGGQLPIGTDLFIVEGIARRVEQRADVVIAPAFVFSPTGYAASGPAKGTVDISVQGFIAYCSEVLQNYLKMGFENMVLMVHHQSVEIRAFLYTALRSISMYSAWRALGEGWWTDGKEAFLPGVHILDATLDAGGFGGHAGQGETDAMLSLCPQLVNMQEATPEFWNATAGDADEQRANESLEKVLQAWVDTLKATYREILW